MDLFTSKGAEFSVCGLYRYILWRIWDTQKPLVMFIGLNPSTANATSDDPTIRRVKRFAHEWGYGGVYMLNCFPYISTDPKKLYNFGNTKENDDWLKKISDKCDKIVFAWGSFDVVEDKFRDQEMMEMFPDAEALIINRNGSPRHPLYVKSDTKTVKFNTTKEQNL